MEEISVIFSGSSSAQEQPQSSGSGKRIINFGYDNVSIDYSKFGSVNTPWVGF